MDRADRERWYVVREAEHIPSPRVVVFRDRLVGNIDAAIRVAGSADRLRPHVKTHKCAKVVALHLERGVTRFKCATTAEADMLGAAGARDVLVAYQLMGPALQDLHAVARSHPATRFSCLLDSLSVFRAVEAAGERNGVVLGAFVDLDVGMHRTGVAPGEGALDLYRAVAGSRWVEPRGIHAYDGHIHDNDYHERCARAREARQLAVQMREHLESEGLPVGELVLGGTPTFPCHASSDEAASLSPGTYVYSDWGYAQNYPDLPFEPAAVVVGRVISTGVGGRFTVDVGSKAIAADPPQPRGTILNLPDARPGKQSEEHWVFSLDVTPSIGTLVYILPTHICPTIEHHDEVYVVSSDGMLVDRWFVDARGRALRLAPGEGSAEGGPGNR